MLPSSHFPLIDDSPASRCGRGRPRRGEPEAKAQPGQREPSVESAQALAGAFSEFIAASSRLEKSYRDLQEQVSALKTELAARRAALRQSRAENERMRLALRQIVDAMPCGVLVAGADRSISILNPEANNLLDSGDRLQLEQPDGLRRLCEATGIDFDACAAGGSGGEGAREFCLRRDGAARWIEVRNRRLVDTAGGKTHQTILILRDVTARKRAEEDREAGRNAMARAELAGVLAHEIRNPLASLELFAELIENDEKGRGQWISHLRAGLRSLAATVNNVLSLHSGEFALHPMELGTALAGALDFAMPILDQAGLTLNTRPAGGPVWVLGNRAALQQLILNLASNAVRHTPPGGNITVFMRRSVPADGQDSGGVTVEFADSGRGIAPELMGRIFAPGCSGGGDRPGLGLAVCRRIMQRHGGEISADNGVDGGARFTLRFPEIDPEPERL